MADFQQFYGLDATTIGKDIDYQRAGILCSQLPQASRVMREYDSSLTWDDETMILANIEYEMRVLLYGMCDKRSRPAQKPEILKPLKNKREREAARQKNLTVDGGQISTMSTKELGSRLGLK